MRRVFLLCLFAITIFLPLAYVRADTGSDAGPPAVAAGPSTSPSIPDPTADPADWLKTVFNYAMKKEFIPLLAAILVGVVAFLRWKGKDGTPKIPIVKWVPWFGTKWGGWTLNLIVSLIGAIGTALASVGPGGVTWGLILQAVLVAITAATGWQLWKDAKA